MRTRFRWATTVLFGAAALLSNASAATAQPVGLPRHGPGGAGACQSQIAADVGLTDAQLASLKTLQSQTEASIQSIADQGEALHERIHAAASAASPDRCAIGDLVIQGVASHQQIDLIGKNAEAAFVASLTADQKAKYDAFRAAHPDCTAVGGRMRSPMMMHP